MDSIYKGWMGGGGWGGFPSDDSMSREINDNGEKAIVVCGYNAITFSRTIC